MRWYAVFLLPIFAAGCGGPSPQGNPEYGSREASDAMSDEAASTRAPGIAPTAAPGVAFNYRYAFRLPANQIASVQEQHAAACEKLGLDRCRITGMRYRLINRSDIEGMLAFKLDPAIARRFGKQGIDSVAKAEGMLVDSEITGEDAGAAITLANRNEAGLAEELRKIEEQLARPGLKPAERAELQAQAQQLRQSIRANAASREERRESLATTPMTFAYGSGDLAPGFDTHPPLRKAIRDAADNFIGGASLLFVVVVTLLPWALLLALGWWAYRRLVAPRIRRETPDVSPPPAGE